MPSMCGSLDLSPSTAKTNRWVGEWVWGGCGEVPVSELLVGIPQLLFGGVSNYLLSDEVFAVWLSGSDSPMDLRLWAQLS